MRCHGTKCPLLTAFLSLSFFHSEVVPFLPEGVIVGFRNFVCVRVFFGKNEKRLASPEMARKLIRKCFNFLLMGGGAEGLACTDPGARAPISASGIFLIVLGCIIFC